MAVIISPGELADALEHLGPRLHRELRKRSVAIALRMERAGKDNATSRLRKRSGTLRRSVAGRVRPSRSGLLQIELSAGGRNKGKDVPYARLQDLGGTVRPKKAKWLAIPHESVQTGAGVPRYASPRLYPRPLRFMYLFFGLGALVEDTKRGPKVRWWLRKKTTVPASYFLRDAFRAEAALVPPTLLGAFSRVMPGGE